MTRYWFFLAFNDHRRKHLCQNYHERKRQFTLRRMNSCAIVKNADRSISTKVPPKCSSISVFIFRGNPSSLPPKCTAKSKKYLMSIDLLHLPRKKRRSQGILPWPIPKPIAAIFEEGEEDESGRKGNKMARKWICNQRQRGREFVFIGDDVILRGNSRCVL